MLEAATFIGNPASIHKAVVKRAACLSAHGRYSRKASTLLRIRSFSLRWYGGQCAGPSRLLHDRRILMTATEHDSVRKAARAASIIPVMPSGEVSREDLETMLRKGGPALVCVMAANNETGVINPLREIAALCQTYCAYLHVDAVQYAARHVMTVRGLTCVAISGHKAGGLKGAGALLLSGDMPVKAMMPGVGRREGGAAGRPHCRALPVWRRRCASGRRRTGRRSPPAG